MAETTNKTERSVVPHKYSFDATLKRSIPVTEPEAQVRIVCNTLMRCTFRKICTPRISFCIEMIAVQSSSFNIISSYWIFSMNTAEGKY
jgi:hypothetical protein